MSYRMVYFRIRTDGYASGWESESAKALFREESRRLFQELGWELHAGSNGSSDTVTKDRQDLYLHPDSFSGVMEEDSLCKSNWRRCGHDPSTVTPLTAMRNTWI